jgi:hypothetical protein
MSTTKLAEAARAVIDRWDSPAWKDAPHTGEYIHALRQALASYEAEPAVQVVVERERVWVKRGVQSFMLAYEAETDAEREWYAGQLRAALPGFVKTKAEAKHPCEPLTNIESPFNACQHREHCKGWKMVATDVVGKAQAKPAPAGLCERICAAIKATDDKSVDEAGYMLDSNDCITIVREQFAAAPAAPALTGYVVRNKAQVAEAVAAFGPTKDLGYLWSYMHGADDIEATEACAHLEVVRLYSAPAAPAPSTEGTNMNEQQERDFDTWWDSDRLTEGNPFAEDTKGFWAWEGWQARAALRQALEAKPAPPFTPEERKALEKWVAAAPAAPAPEPLTDADLLDLTPERAFGLTPEIEAYIVASMRAAIAAASKGEQA